MPNWAETSVMYYGDRDRIAELHEAYKHALNRDVIKLFMKRSTFDETDIPAKIAEMRSYIMDYELEGESCLYAHHEDAWEPDVEGYATIAAHFGVNFELFSTEPGGELAVKTDKEGKFFPTEIVVFSSYFCEDIDPSNNPICSIFESSEEYFDSLDDLIRAVRTIFPAFSPKDIEDAQFQPDAAMQLYGTEPGLIKICKVEIIEKPTLPPQLEGMRQ